MTRAALNRVLSNQTLQPTSIMILDVTQGYKMWKYVITGQKAALDKKIH